VVAADLEVSSRRLWLHVEHSPRRLPSPAWLLHCLGARASTPITIHNHRVKKTVLLFYFIFSHYFSPSSDAAAMHAGIF